jgi:cytochrome b
MAAQDLSTLSAGRTGQPHAAVQVPVWDRVVRLVHWGLVACVLLNFGVLEEGEGPHRVTGYLAVALVLLRVVWGFVGSRHARFADFFPTPARLRAHLADLRAGRPARHLGHNPLGAVMMLSLMALVLALGVTGYLQGLDAFFGEAWLQHVHEALAQTLVGLAGVHAAAAIVMGRLERTHLVAAMVTGRKAVPAQGD